MKKRTTRFQEGINKYGFNSDFRREIEVVVDKHPINTQELENVFEKYGV